jgi:flavorubredoxin
MEPARRVTPDIEILPSYFPIPGFGMIPVNAFVLKAAQPVLVDTGVPLESEQFMTALETLIDPEDLKWIWLAHPDQDHVGSLQALIRRVPDIRVITTFLGFGYMSLFNPLPPDRVFLLNPGEKIDVGDRELLCLKPPSFDNPATTEVYDMKSRALFSSDCFGAMLQGAAEEAGDIPPAELHEGQMMWSRVDAPWLHKVDQAKFAAELEAIRSMDPAIVLSSHLPPARALLPQMLETLARVPGSEPLMLPNQAQLEVMVAQMTQGAAKQA